MKAQRIDGKTLTQHKLENTVCARLYNLFSGLKQKCRNPHHVEYERFGAKGVTFDLEFNEFYEFVLSEARKIWLPQDDLAVIRKVREEGYTLSNLKVISKKYKRKLRGYTGHQKPILISDRFTGEPLVITSSMSEAAELTGKGVAYVSLVIKNNGGNTGKINYKILGSERVPRSEWLGL